MIWPPPSPPPPPPPPSLPLSLFFRGFLPGCLVCVLVARICQVSDPFGLIALIEQDIDRALRHGVPKNLSWQASFTMQDAKRIKKVWKGETKHPFTASSLHAQTSWDLGTSYWEISKIFPSSIQVPLVLLHTFQVSVWRSVERLNTWLILAHPPCPHPSSRHAPGLLRHLKSRRVPKVWIKAISVSITGTWIYKP